jgi:pimeloyl-ACP methyl ester carboxylesterase
MRVATIAIAVLALIVVGCDEADLLEEDPASGDRFSEPFSPADEDGPGDVEIEVVNASGVEICDISIVPSSASEWGDNLLDDSLQPGEGFSYYEVGPGPHDLLAVDCDDEVVAEEIGVEVGPDITVWRIGAPSPVARGSQEEGSANPLEPDQREPVGESAAFREADCPFDLPPGLNVYCGYLLVPENRSRASSPTIQLAVAVRPAPEGTGQLAPIVYLAGGPGGSALDDFTSDPQSWDYPFARTRDLVFVDQRGTGYSVPTLDCPELSEATSQDENPEEKCRERLLSDGVDLTAYNTAENAADISALREALGYAEWDLLGISYGTRLALNMMRDHPQGIRSVILDSPFPPNADTPVDEALNVMESLETLFAGCARDDACDRAFPNLRQLFLETVARMNDEPEGDFYGDDLVFAVVEALNNTDLIPLLPLVIWEVAQGDLDILDEISQDGGFGRRQFQDDEDRSDSEGMYNSVICHDEYAFGDYDAVERSVLDDIPDELEASMLNPVFEIFQMCELWEADTADAIENSPVFSDIPTLILVGEYDHATPPKWGRLTQETLSNSYLFEFPGMGHSLLSGIECAIQISGDFLDNPTVEPDSGCLSRMGGPDFQLP